MSKRWIVAFASLVQLACSKPTENPISKSEEPPPPVLPLRGTALAASGESPAFGLSGKLETEAHQRVADTPKAEDVYAAFEKAGLTLREKQQHVASIFGANFCLGAKAEHDVAFSLCEFADEAAAKTGRDASLRGFARVPNREIVLRQKSMLTIRQPPTKTPSSEATAAHALRIFAQL